MAGSFKTDFSRGVHPEVIAKLFKTHIRTVFRWFKKGHLKSVGPSSLGDKEQVLALLISLYSTYSLKEAQQKLKITNNTILAWRKKGIIQGICPFGFWRISLASVRAIPQLIAYQPGQKKVLLNTESATTLEPIIKDVGDDFGPEIESRAKIRAIQEMDRALRSFARKNSAIRKEVIRKYRHLKKH